MKTFEQYTMKLKVGYVYQTIHNEFEIIIQHDDYNDDPYLSICFDKDFVFGTVDRFSDPYVKYQKMKYYCEDVDFFIDNPQTLFYIIKYAQHKKRNYNELNDYLDDIKRNDDIILLIDSEDLGLI